MTQWTYQTITTAIAQFHTLEPQLNELGGYGWEVCGFTTTPAVGMVDPASVRVILKRAV